MSETSLVKQFMVQASLYDALLQRNNSGGFQDPTGRWVFYGLGNEGRGKAIGSSDLIGPKKVVILPEHVGRTVGVMCCAEVKLPGWTHAKDAREKRQLEYIAAMKAAGCLAGIVRTPQELENLLRF